jgi:hypothetical protein
LEARRVELQDRINELNQRIVEQVGQQAGNAPRPGPGGFAQPAGNSLLIAERDQVKAVVAEVAQEIQIVKPQVPEAKDRSALSEDVKAKEAAFKSALADLRPQVDAVTKSYAELAADASVKKAIDDLKKANKVSVKLGPSEKFLNAARELDQAERLYLGKKPTSPATKKKAKSKR